MKLPDLKIREGEPYPESDMVAASQFLSNLSSAVRMCERILVDGAGREGWLDPDGNLQHGWSYLPPGEETGGLHVWETRNVYQQVPSPALVAEYIEELDSAERLQYIQALIEKMRTDWFQSWLRKTPDWEFIQAKLNAHDEGFLTVYGDYSIEVRKNPPDETTQEVKPNE